MDRAVAVFEVFLYLGLLEDIFESNMSKIVRGNGLTLPAQRGKHLGLPVEA